MSGDIDHFADEIQARDLSRFHCSSRQFTGVQAACGDFGFLVAFGAGWSDAPCVKCLAEFIEPSVGERARVDATQASDPRNELEAQIAEHCGAS